MKLRACPCTLRSIDDADCGGHFPWRHPWSDATQDSSRNDRCELAQRSCKRLMSWCVQSLRLQHRLMHAAHFACGPRGVLSCNHGIVLHWPVAIEADNVSTKTPMKPLGIDAAIMCLPHMVSNLTKVFPCSDRVSFSHFVPICWLHGARLSGMSGCLKAPSARTCRL